MIPTSVNARAVFRQICENTPNPLTGVKLNVRKFYCTMYARADECEAGVFAVAYMAGNMALKLL